MPLHAVQPGRTPETKLADTEPVAETEAKPMSPSAGPIPRVRKGGTAGQPRETASYQGFGKPPVVFNDSDPSMWEKIQRGQMPGFQNVFYPDEHYAMTKRGSQNAGFPPGVAGSIASSTRNVDYTAFHDPHAHASRAPGETSEQSIDNNIAVMYGMGTTLRGAIAGYATSRSPVHAQAIIDELGRINHEMQDAYAHQGMSYEQHAAMDAAGTSPDFDPATAAKAAEMTNRLMGLVSEQMRARGIDPQEFQAPITVNLTMPDIDQFIPMVQYTNATAPWDGKETRWPSKTIDQMYAAFERALRLIRE